MGITSSHSAYALGWRSCSGCGQSTRCQCEKDRRTKNDRYVDEVLALDAKMRRSAGRDTNARKPKPKGSDAFEAAVKKQRGR